MPWWTRLVMAVEQINPDPAVDDDSDDVLEELRNRIAILKAEHDRLPIHFTKKREDKMDELFVYIGWLNALERPNQQ
jgi:hypothetical protein